MNVPLVRVDCSRSVARITLNRPDKRNALSRALLAELDAAVQRVDGDPAVRAMVLAAEGPVFCAGMDLAEMQERAGHPDAQRLWMDDTRAYRELIERIFRLRVPTIAAVQGPVLAGGVGIVMACDLVVASDAATFALPEPKRGITAAIVTPLLVYRTGAAAASHLLLSGRTWSAEDGRRAGACHEVVPPGELAARIDALVASVLAGAPGALALTKRLLQDCAAFRFDEQLDAGMKVSAFARETEEAREGLAAFLEKRPPRWADPAHERAANRSPASPNGS